MNPGRKRNHKNNQNAHVRRRKLTSFLHILLWIGTTHVYFLPNRNVMCHAATTTTASNSSSEPSEYTWENWNYYQILGLSPAPVSDDSYHNHQSHSVGKQPLPSRRQRARDLEKIKAEDIKKAYRKQAQLWHPDKIASRK